MKENSTLFKVFFLVDFSKTTCLNKYNDTRLDFHCCRIYSKSFKQLRAQNCSMSHLRLLLIEYLIVNFLLYSFQFNLDLELKTLQIRVNALNSLRNRIEERIPELYRCIQTRFNAFFLENIIMIDIFRCLNVHSILSWKSEVSKELYPMEIIEKKLLIICGSYSKSSDSSKSNFSNRSDSKDNHFQDRRFREFHRAKSHYEKCAHCSGNCSCNSHYYHQQL